MCKPLAIPVQGEDMPETESNIVDTARREILVWLRAGHRNPFFFKDRTDAESKAHAEIVARFLSWVQPVGFTLQIVNEGTESEPKWSGHWRFQENDLQGFKQPPLSGSRDDARLLACAALLQNEWSRSRLP